MYIEHKSIAGDNMVSAVGHINKPEARATECGMSMLSDVTASYSKCTTPYTIGL